MDPTLFVILIVFFVPGLVSFSMAKHHFKEGVLALVLTIFAAPALLLAYVGVASISELYVIVVGGLVAIASIGTAAGAVAGWYETE